MRTKDFFISPPGGLSAAQQEFLLGITEGLAQQPIGWAWMPVPNEVKLNLVPGSEGIH